MFCGTPKMNFIIDQVALKNNIVKEGWIWKKTEHLRNWKLRYYVLLRTGHLLGYKSNPDAQSIETPSNYFNIKKCEVSEMDGMKQFAFILKYFRDNSKAERTFSLTNDDDRKEWIRAIKSVSECNSLINLIEPEVIKVTFHDFEYLQVLGRGTFGKVMLCKEKSSQKLFAIKVLKKEVIATRQQLNRTLTENRILKCINHPFIASLKYSFQTTNHVCFVMDYINGGELFFHLKKFSKFSEDKARFYTAEIISALSYLHALDVVYRDIKTENVLLDQDGHIKLVDFGLSREGLIYGVKSKSFCGTPEYMAPEVIRRLGYGREVDWWSTGVILFEMICGYLPFYHANFNNLFSLILLKNPKIPGHLSKEAKNLIYSLLRKNPKQRLGFGPSDGEDIKKHPFFKSINWLDLDDRKIKPPFIPTLENNQDTKYFDLVVACESTSFTPPVHNQLSKEEDEKLFGRFNFKNEKE